MDVVLAEDNIYNANCSVDIFQWQSMVGGDFNSSDSCGCMEGHYWQVKELG